ncbi:hypothetical protein B4U79_18706 [Dinothrombium tinctorium]|uniref:Peptidase M13 N-terminal domain-containing protein n=1 Tax=Dinothrombium tinctorium TaxID=1965070 RepID=A0A443QAX7_9ACAR|nr:hypothetical protein B4U79_18706 [Dinothrombium tinctorium]
MKAAAWIVLFATLAVHALACVRGDWENDGIDCSDLCYDADILYAYIKVKLCYATTESVFHEAISYLYMKKYLKDEGIEDLYGFLSQLKTSLNYSLEQAKWMNNETRRKAQFKLDKMVANLGLPENIHTIEQLDKAFEPTGWISSENYVNAYRKMMKFHGKNKLRLVLNENKRRFTILKFEYTNN